MSENYGIGQFDNPTKNWLYYIDFTVVVDSVSELDEIREDFLHPDWRLRFMEIPSATLGQEGFEIEGRIDIEEDVDFEELADFLFEGGYITDEEYMNFEELVNEND